MELTSINLGQLRPDPSGRPGRTTGIYKLPVTGPVEVTRLGLAGDVIISTKHHGGPDQAVYVYGQADYDWWAGELDRELAPGTFGENLTLSGLESAAFDIGDLLHIGNGITLQVTAPRIPCATFAARMDDPQFVKKFRHAERPGFYCRVLKEGRILAGDPVWVEEYPGETVSLLHVYRDYYEPELTEAAIRRILAAPVAIRIRKDKEEELQKHL
jgi:MOSC domain-containing protein YiiM